MYNSSTSTEGYEIYRCLLCYEAICSEVCPHMDPARIIRALRFDNREGAAWLLPETDFCSHCPAPCTTSCPIGVAIPNLTAALRQQANCQAKKPELATIDLSCQLCGISMENPFLLSSSVIASNYDMCARAFEAGWAGAAFKTISLMEIHEASPRFSALKSGDGAVYGFKNIEQLSDRSVEENLETISRLKHDYPNKILIASIMGRNEQEWETLAQAVSSAGADVVECNFSCPHMEAKGVGVDVGQSPDAVAQYTAAARRGTQRPLFIKLTPNVADMRPMARAGKAAGANGIAAINTIKSITEVDLNSYVAAPAVHGRSALGGYSGAAIKPIALRFLAELAADPQLQGMHLSGMGGIETWRSALEFLVLGAGSIQITTAVMQYGYRIIDDLLLGLRIYMAKRGIAHIDDLIGVAVPNIVDTDALDRDTLVYPRFHLQRCLGCGRCYLSCMDGGHQAIDFDIAERRPRLRTQACVGCHLCTLVCPEQAISGSGKRVTKQFQSI